jgi:hypothetical protein
MTRPDTNPVIFFPCFRDQQPGGEICSEAMNPLEQTIRG